MVAVRLSLVGVLWLAIFGWGAGVRGDDDPPESEVPVETTDYPEIDFPSYHFITFTKETMPWLKRYHSFDGDFAKQNELAFRFSRRGWNGPAGLSLVMSDPRTSARSKQAVIHFASACYTDVRDWAYWHEIFRISSERDTLVVAGMLEILRSARTLKPDGTNTAWPATGLLDPQGMPQRIVGVLKNNPELALDVILTLEAYGPLAQKEAEVLMPFLLSPDPKIVAAAQAAILKMDPQGLAKFFRLDGKPLVKQQSDMIREYTADASNDPVLKIQPVCDLRESDGSPQSELSRMRHELRRWMRLQNSNRNITRGFDKQQELALHFRDQKLPGDWWKVLGVVSPDEGRFFGTNPKGHLDHIASALYTKPGAQADMLRVLHDDDPRIAQAMSELVSGMRLYKPGINSYYDGDMVDPDVIPGEFVKVAERHPHLKVELAYHLIAYKSHAVPYVNTLVPSLLSNDTHDVRCIRECITKIDPELAKKLEITINDSGSRTSTWVTFAVDGPPPLTPRQRELIEAYLKEHPPTAPAPPK